MLPHCWLVPSSTARYQESASGCLHSSCLVPLQSKLFPQYFMLQTAGSAIALATLYYSGTGILKPQLYSLGGNAIAFHILSSCLQLTCSSFKPCLRQCLQLDLGVHCCACMPAGVALVGSLANWLAVEPHTTGIMLERYELENAPQRDNDTISKRYKTFSKWCAMKAGLT
jgi:hypothetical protein